MKVPSKKKLFLLSFILTMVVSYAQSKWNIRFGTEEFTGLQCANLSWDRPDVLVTSPTGEIYVSGTNSYSTGNPKPKSIGTWIMKYNTNGQLVWYRCPGADEAPPDARILTALNDGGVFTASVLYNPRYSSLKNPLNVYKYNSAGILKENVLSNSDLKFKMDNQTYTPEEVDFPVFAFQNPDGSIGVILNITLRVVTKQNNITRSEPVQKVALLYLDQELKYKDGMALDFPPIRYLIDENNYTSYFRAEAHIQGGFTLVLKDKNTRQNITIARFDKNGKKLWSVEKKYSSAIYNDAITHLPTGETVWMACGVNGTKNDEYYVFDNNGTEIKKFSVKNEGAVQKIKSINNDFVILHQLEQAGEGTIVLKRINDKGNIVWRKTFGQKSSYGIDISVGKDNSIILLAYTKEFGACDLDGMLIKVTEMGDTEPLPKKYTKVN